MEDYIDLDFKVIIQRIQKLNPALRYASCLKFFDLVRPYFFKFILNARKKFFFRVRAHNDNNENNYFRNISDLPYRTDLFNILNYGRCNCPFETVFYCSDNPFLAFLEVSRLTWNMNDHGANYYTTSIWKMRNPLNITPIFESLRKWPQNEKILKIKKSCNTVINEMLNYKKKEQLKSFHNLIGKEFAKPFSKRSSSYLFSAAVSNYLLENKHGQSENIDGLIYSTCINDDTIRNLGLNYAFNPLIIGFDKKIEFVGAFRSKIEKLLFGIRETERKFFIKANRYTGEILW